MFRRREDGSEELIEDTAGSEGAKLVTNPAGATPSTPVSPAVASPGAAAAAAPAFRPVPPQAAMVAASRPSMPSVAAPSASTSDASRASVPANRGSAKRVLTVGPDIQMKGEITSCDRVVIDGMVDATMRDVHTVELTETGSLKGTAEVEDAEISGTFEGDITVRGKLTVHASGRIRGNITYGEIEIQRGGQISGNIRNIADAKAGAGAQKKAA
jgi:cytoskeletal protein CcmA (bactofilin family)